MKKIKHTKLTLEAAMLWTIVSAMENAAELGCPQTKEVDMWIRELAEDDPKAALKVMGKLRKIMDI